MSHEFKIMDSSNVIITYTDYDDIPLATLKHVISFIPDLGTLIDSNEILLETDTIDAGVTDNFVTESTLTTIGIELEAATSIGELLLETGDKVSFQDIIFIEEKTFTDGDNLVFNGTDSSSTDAGSNIIVELRDGRHKLVPEDFADGEENHLVLETASDVNTTDHYHFPAGEPHVNGDGHTEEEHREIALWNFKLKTLITQEITNASSL